MTEPFYKIPKSLFTDEQYRNISTDTKILFALLLDRQSLSASKGWIDNRGPVHQYLTIQNTRKANSLGFIETKMLKQTIEHLQMFLTYMEGEYLKPTESELK